MEELIAKYLIISGVSGAAIVFISKSAIKAAFDASLKKYQSNVDMFKVEHEVKFAKLHVERANFIITLYHKLHDLQKDLLYLTSLFQGPEWSSDDERKKKAKETHNIVVEMFEKNRFYFEESFNEDFEITLNLSLSVLQEMDRAKLNYDRWQNRENQDEYFVDIWQEQHEKVNFQIRNKRLELADYIRKILGVKV